MLHSTFVVISQSIYSMLLLIFNFKGSTAASMWWTSSCFFVWHLDPSDSFSAFNKEKLIRLSQLYPDNFFYSNRVRLGNQLATYIIDMRTNCELFEVKGIGRPCSKDGWNKKGHYISFSLFALETSYQLSLLLLRVFSAMKIVKNRLHKRMEDKWMNDYLLAHIENDIFNSIDDETIRQCFQNMKIVEGNCKNLVLELRWLLRREMYASWCS